MLTLRDETSELSFPKRDTMMDQKFRDEVAYLRSLTSEDALQWILRHHPVLPRCIAHRTWAPREQHALLKHYLQVKRPFATQRGYDWLLKATSVSRVVRRVSVMLHEAPMDQSDIDLLVYYLRPALRQATRSERQEEEVSALFAQIEAQSDINTLP